MPQDQVDPEGDSLAGAAHIDEDTVEVILATAEGIDTIVVGGQALNLLAQMYSDRAPLDLAAYAPYTSKDLDYWGMRDAAQIFADKIGGEIHFPAEGDTGPSTAQVVFEYDGRRVEVDFLATIAGIQRIDVEADTVQIDLPTRGREVPVRVNVLKPALVLRSRIANISTLRRTDGNTVRQAMAAVIVAREDILAILDEDAATGSQQASRVATRAVREIAESDPGPDQLRGLARDRR